MMCVGVNYAPCLLNDEFRGGAHNGWEGVELTMDGRGWGSQWMGGVGLTMDGRGGAHNGWEEWAHNGWEGWGSQWMGGVGLTMDGRSGLTMDGRVGLEWMKGEAHFMEQKGGGGLTIYGGRAQRSKQGPIWRCEGLCSG